MNVFLLLSFLWLLLLLNLLLLLLLLLMHRILVKYVQTVTQALCGQVISIRLPIKDLHTYMEALSNGL